LRVPATHFRGFHHPSPPFRETADFPERGAADFPEPSEGKAWRWNAEATELILGDAAFSAQLLGTYSRQSETFLWAWANPDCTTWTASLEIARKLRVRGVQPGYSVFREPKISPLWVNPHELAYVSGELSGGHTVFVGDYDGGAALLLITSVQVEFQKIPLAYIPGILLDHASYSLCSPRLSARRFAERMGFETRETADCLVATRPDCEFAAKLDETGRITSVSFDAGDRAAGARRPRLFEATDTGPIKQRVSFHREQGRSDLPTTPDFDFWKSETWTTSDS
jgi:hypothetical protein